MAPPRPRFVAWLALTLLAAGCAEVSTLSPEAGTNSLPQLGDAATWQLQQPEHVDPLTQGWFVEVTRLGCASGKTGEVLEPQIAYGEDRIVIRTDAAPPPDEANDCQGNDTVPVEINLDQSIGDRDLVDAACIVGEAASTAACDNAVRWTSPSRGATAEIPDWEPSAHYSFVQAGCRERAFIGRYAVTVAGGAVTLVEPIGESYDGITPDQTPTLSDMLAQAREAVEEGTVEVAVDGAGVPRWIYADPIPNGIDDEVCYAISDYRQL